MTSVPTMPTQSLAAMTRELYLLLVELQDRRAAPAPGYAERLQTVAERARAYAAVFANDHPRLSQTLSRVGERVELLRKTLAAGQPLRETMTRSCAQHYEALARLIRSMGRDEGIELPVLKPRNYARNVFHVCNGLMSATLYTIFPKLSTMLWIAYAYTGWLVSLELLRRSSPRINAFLVNRVFGAIARPVEAHRINSATWYGVAIILMLYLFPPVACIAAVLILGVGDPAAANIGRRWGRHKLIGGKSLEGSLGFVAVAAVCCTVFLVATSHPAIQRGAFGPTLRAAALLSLVGAIAGSVTELLSTRIEDNFSIPLVTAAAVTACLAWT
jgi:dolichol kinase